MREIKFRLYSNTLKVMYSPETEIGHLWSIKEAPNGKVKVDDRDILMQFTGLKDKNGKDIFEGDIVDYVYYIQTSVDPDSMPMVYKGIGIIEFIEGCFMIRTNIENPIPLHYGDLTFEIIGNIYENPELLKQ